MYNTRIPPGWYDRVGYITTGGGGGMNTALIGRHVPGLPQHPECQLTLIRPHTLAFRHLLQPSLCPAHSLLSSLTLPIDPVQMLGCVLDSSVFATSGSGHLSTTGSAVGGFLRKDIFWFQRGGPHILHPLPRCGQIDHGQTGTSNH